MEVLYPDMLQVQGNVPDERFNESLLQPEPPFSLVERLVFNLSRDGKFRTDDKSQAQQNLEHP